MLHSHLQAPPSFDNSEKVPLSTPHRSYQHGIHPNPPHSASSTSCPLLCVPAETLTDITSFLDPPALLALGAACRALHGHVEDDNTWHRAFVCHALGIGPESELRADDARALMLRRGERSWRSEFVARYNLTRRWARSRNTTVTHIPLHSPIAQLHLLPSAASPTPSTGPGLLSVSLQYGIVARSLPLTGKILPGFLNTQPPQPPVGMGNGNPNAEFSPSVSACALFSPPAAGTSAKVLWGFRTGEVAATLAPRVMDPSRRRVGVEMVRCAVGEEHAGAVLDAVWEREKGAWGVTAGEDGKVKIWELAGAGIRCVWTSEPKASAFADACIKVGAAVTCGGNIVVAAVMRSGDVHIWNGFEALFGAQEPENTPKITKTTVPCPASPPPYTVQGLNTSHEVLAFHIDPSSLTPTVLVAYQHEPYFYRIRVDASGGQGTTSFGDPSFGPLSVVTPFFHTVDDAGGSFVLVGDYMGCVSVYVWGAYTPSPKNKDPVSTTEPALSPAIRPIRKLEAHPDASPVTALAWNGACLATGSARGTTHIFDGLTFLHVRSFASPGLRARGATVLANPNPNGNPVVNAWHGQVQAQDPRRDPVAHITLGTEREVLCVAVGDRVMAWRAGAVPKPGPGGVRGRHASGNSLKKKRVGTAKWLQQAELHETITESRALLTLEQQDSQRAYGRERAQRAGLERLGLSEGEALEYVLMLSREEEETARRQREAMGDTEVSVAIDEGVFEGDFDDDNDEEAAGPSRSYGYSSSSASSTSSSGGSLSRQSSTASFTAESFPPISRSPSTSGRGTPVPSRKSSRASLSTSPGTSTHSTASTSISTSTSTNAWRIPNSAGTPSALRASLSSSVSPTPRGAWARGSPPVSVGGGTSPVVHSHIAGSPSGGRLSAGPSPGAIAMGVLNEDPEMDEDLRFALELSLAEAKSRGEDV